MGEGMNLTMGLDLRNLNCGELFLTSSAAAIMGVISSITIKHPDCSKEG
jgi:hypothetical protein